MRLPRMPRLRGACLALVVAGGAAALPGGTARAQPSWPPGTLVEIHDLWSPGRGARLLEALQAGAPHVPGEVLVKFRAGASPLARQMSLDAAPATPAAGEARWVGDLLLVRFPSTDAAEVARVLSLQPDVDYAVPNGIRWLQRATDTEPADASHPDPGSCVSMPSAEVDTIPDPPACQSVGSDLPPRDLQESDRARGAAPPERQRLRSSPPVAPASAAADRSRPSSGRSASTAAHAWPAFVISAPPGPAPGSSGPAGPSSAAPADWTRAYGSPGMRPSAALTASRPGEIVRPSPVPLVPDDFDGNQQWNFSLLDMARAWEINPGGSSQVIVAIVDSGVTTVSQTILMPLLWNGTQLLGAGLSFAINPDLDPTRFVGARDFTFVPAILGSPTRVMDMLGHGTHVAGTIAQSTNNSFGVAGMAYRTRLMPLKACVGFWEIQMLWAVDRRTGVQDVLPFGDAACTDDAIVAAIRHAADQGAHVVNLSLGSTSEAPAILQAIEYANARGTFVAVSAGNTFERGNLPQYPAAYAPTIGGVVAVGAVDRHLQRAYYSTTNAYVTLAAPGGDTSAGAADGIHQITLHPSDFHPSSPSQPRFDIYRIVSQQGTSMAAPHVAGLAALLISQGVTRPAAIEAAMTHFARDLGPPGTDHEYGAGLIQPRDTLRGLGLLR